MPKVLSMVGYSGSEIGVIFSAAPLVRFLLPFAFTKGLKLNKHNFNFALLVMLFSSISFYLSLENFYALFLSNIGLGIGMSLILPYIEVVALDVIGKERYGKIRLFGSVGFILVALVLVKFLTSPDVALAFLTLFTLFSSILAFYIARASQKKHKGVEGDSEQITLLRHWKLWLGLTLMQVSFGAFYNFFTLYETSYGVSLDMTINLWVFGVVVEIAMLYFQGRLLKFDLVMLLKLTTLSTVFRWLLLYLYPQNLPILFFSQSLHALSFALFYSSAISYLHQLYSNKVLAQQFFSGVTFGLGGLVGALSFGYIYEFDRELTFLVASFVALVAFVSLYFWGRETKS
jgi:PPP family 3-phenylpropionic acid transporter